MNIESSLEIKRHGKNLTRTRWEYEKFCLSGEDRKEAKKRERKNQEIIRQSNEKILECIMLNEQRLLDIKEGKKALSANNLPIPPSYRNYFAGDGPLVPAVSVYKMKGGKQDLSEIVDIYSGDGLSEFFDLIGNQCFDCDQTESIKACEVYKNPNGDEAKKVYACVIESTLQREKIEAARAKKYPACTSYAKKAALTEKLKSLSLARWIEVCCSVHQTIMASVVAIDLNIKKIAEGSGKYRLEGLSTIAQLEKVLELKEQKEMLINIYMLNSFFAALLKSEDEQDIFAAFFLKMDDIVEASDAKLRSLYRGKRRVMKRLKEFCLRRGYNEEWFFYHFAYVPSVRYAVEDSQG